MAKPNELAALEAAVKHHADELSPSMRARIFTVTVLRRTTMLAAVCAFIALFLWLDENARSSVAVLLPCGILGTLTLNAADRSVRLAMARAALRDVERATGVISGVGAAGGASTAGASSFVLPGSLPAPAKKPPPKRARPVKPAAPDREAVDFDDAA